MKRTMAWMLALLMLAGCVPAGALAQSDPPSLSQFIPVEAGASFVWDEDGTAPEYELLAASIQAGMLLSGRPVYGPGLTACAVDPFCQYACVLVAREDELQLTILEKTADGRWRTAAWNDTIPAGAYNHPSLRWAQSTIVDEETDTLMTLDTGRFRISRESFAWEGSQRDERSAQILEVARDDVGVWRVFAVRDARFDQAVAGRCPYLTWDSKWGGTNQWVLRAYELIQIGRAWERSDCLGKAVLTEEDMADRDVVNGFDYPAFLEFLRSVTPAAIPGGLAPDSVSDANAPSAGKGEALIAAAERMASLLAEEGMVYYNPAGGAYYHASVICQGEDVADWPLSPVPIGSLNDPEFSYLSPCPICGRQDDRHAFVYYNPDGGRYYHATATCASVDERYWPLTAIFYEMLHDPSFSRLMPCPKCNPPERPQVTTTDEN